jgi:alcohol dehydrogenase
MQRHSLLLHAPHQLAWTTEDLPPLGPRDVLVRTIAGAISIGTELPLYRGDSRGVHQPVYPLMTGYESLAEVLANGADVKRLAPGDRVVATYGHRTMAVLDETRAIPVPIDIPDQLALLVILACDAAKGVAKLAPRFEDEVLIAGAGTIGLLTLFNLRAYGAHDIDVLEPVAARRALALAFGARNVFDPAAGGHPPDTYRYGFECSSRDAAFGMLQAALAREGRVCLLADGNVEPLTLAPAFHAKELAVVGSSDGLDYQQYALWFWERLREGIAPLERLFEQQVDAAELPELFEQMARSQVTPVKVFVRYEVAQSVKHRT